MGLSGCRQSLCHAFATAREDATREAGKTGLQFVGVFVLVVVHVHDDAHVCVHDPFASEPSGVEPRAVRYPDRELPVDAPAFAEASRPASRSASPLGARCA